MLWLLVLSLLVATSSCQKGQARWWGERPSNGPCIMLHPNTTLHSTTRWGPLLSLASQRIKTADIVSTRLVQAGSMPCPILLLQTGTALSNDCQIHEYDKRPLF